MQVIRKWFRFNHADHDSMGTKHLCVREWQTTYFGALPAGISLQVAIWLSLQLRLALFPNRRCRSLNGSKTVSCLIDMNLCLLRFEVSGFICYQTVFIICAPNLILTARSCLTVSEIFNLSPHSKWTCHCDCREPIRIDVVNIYFTWKHCSVIKYFASTGYDYFSLIFYCIVTRPGTDQAQRCFQV